MHTDVYIGKVKSDSFDWDVAGNWNGYMPTPVCVCDWKGRREQGEENACCQCITRASRCIYWDIVGAKEQGASWKQTDWGCFTLKMTKAKLVATLSQEKYKNEAEPLLTIAQALPDTEEYLLVALET